MMIRTLHEGFLVSVLIFCTTGLSLDLEAQIPEDASLANVDSVDARVVLSWDDDIEGLDENTVRSRLETAFQLRLRQNEIRVSSGAPNYFLMQLTLLATGDGAVAYAYRVDLRELSLSSADVTEDLAVAFAEAFNRCSSEGNCDSSALDEGCYQVDVSPMDLSAECLRFRSLVWDGLIDWFRNDLYEGADWAVTWEGPSGVAIVGRNNLQEGLEDIVSEAADDFVNAYLSVH